MSKITVFTDGGARGNPGPAALGVFIQDEHGKELARIGKTIGEATNNVAEYSAIIEGLNWLLENKQRLDIESANFFMDSQLACSQLNGVYKVKNARIREFVFAIRQKEMELGIQIAYAHVHREQNTKADFMVNQALDNQLESD
ncbi:MAG TPA: ribonuclease HI family protein [Patescibacteria group bacterium]|jgi:ribonuclease HI|nr:ribonuclease HI family protein [Patescibacteria group bacterium]